MTTQSARTFGGMAMLCPLLLCATAMSLPAMASALDLDFPGTPQLVYQSGPAEGQHPVATGPFDGAQVPLNLADGTVQGFIWQIRGEGVSTATILRSVNEQLDAQGYNVEFSCFANACGGFDFRHAVPVGQAPEMHVDLGNFQYVAATIERDEGPERVALMISQGGATSFVHVTQVLPADAVPVTPVVQSSRSPEGVADAVIPTFVDTGDLIARLTTVGSAALDDLQFEIGASQLSGDSYTSLTTLAAYLQENPARRVVLVGHTDAVGSLSGNISLSEARADAVRRFLTGDLGVNPAQIEARGIGYLAPRAANTTAEGRDANRRVEVVLADPG